MQVFAARSDMESPSRPQKEEDYGLSNVFSMRRPRDARAGLASGGKSAAKGMLVGVLGLVVAPIAGGVQDGAVGFAKGLASGTPQRSCQANDVTTVG